LLLLSSHCCCRTDIFLWKARLTFTSHQLRPRQPHPCPLSCLLSYQLEH
jgi:hypothetical protein